jgi:SAM-dependent methyltransferase
VQDLATGYEGRIGRYGPALARAFAAVAGVGPGQRVLDVGCGSGALTEVLVELVGRRGSVHAIDPSHADAAALAVRVPSVHVATGIAEELPYERREFDAVLAQLVVHLVEDAARAASEMRRVARPDAVVATCVWDFSAGMTVLRTYWDAALEVERDLAEQYDQGARYRFATPEELEALWSGAGLHDVATGPLEVAAAYDDFEDLWEPLVEPDGTPGRFFLRLDPQRQDALRTGVFDRLGRPAGAFELSARAWYATGRA